MSFGEELGFTFTLLDIGGGFSYLPDMLDGIKKLSLELNKTIGEITTKHPSLERVVAEPGSLHMMKIKNYLYLVSYYRSLLFLFSVHISCVCH